ncbi:MULTISPECIES: pyrimidine dimer DNA glycosylase/endonuclease V [Sinorhizobium]|uniref:Pyrimidine dimer DNA glycosylase protein n=1 Tax=Rhizobium fredii TaxID=380 RepID=A0A2L0H015_RHIFR|nr:MULTISPECIES: pyrimidine dimer DNA glycosylase/endonuclease V [Sinorhizobium]AUX74777.1 pyrimidine dimer DNA glycosylase protein [Sinorhizobium fredii]PDT41667.1 endonuclease [Sinorhizobium sp. FG01]PDT53644.1 endonuclease [Sinorhizobium sp. NG07B]
MTRINCIPPSELSGPHLLAEYRELPRVFALVRAAIARGETPGDPRNPPAYTLGKGHVRFFYSRLSYLAKRQASLIAEMQRRGYRPTYREAEDLLSGFPSEWCNDWNPTSEAMTVNRERIRERLAGTARRDAGHAADDSPALHSLQCCDATLSLLNQPE